MDSVMSAQDAWVITLSEVISSQRDKYETRNPELKEAENRGSDTEKGRWSVGGFQQAQEADVFHSTRGYQSDNN